MTRRPTLILLAAGLILAALLTTECGSTTIVERVPQTVIVTPEVPEVTRVITVEVRREVPVEVTVVVTRIRRETVVVTATPIPPPDSLGEAAAYQAALRYVIENQRTGGGYGTVKNTAWAILALQAAGVDPATVVTQYGRSPFDYMDRVITDNLVVGAEATALTTLALTASGQETPASFDLEASPHPNGWPALPLTVMALGRRAPDEMVAALVGKLTEASDEGFSNVADAAWGIMALKASGVSADDADPLIAAALDYLRGRQNPDHSWPVDEEETEPDALSTALAMQALAAAGEDPLDWGQPSHALLSLQQDDGSFDGNVATTAAAIIALQETWPGELNTR